MNQVLNLGPIKLDGLMNASLAAASYTRERLHEESFLRKILPAVPADEWSQIEHYEKYSYNPLTKSYIVPSKKVKSGFIPLSAGVVESIRSEYVNDKSTSDIALKYGIPSEYITDILNAFSIKHDSLPFTDEEIKGKTNEQLIKEVLDKRKWEIVQQIEKSSWKSIQDDAVEWQKYKYKQLDPVARALDKWIPPKHTPVTNVPAFVREYGATATVTLDGGAAAAAQRFWPPSDKVFVVGLSDLHFGSATNSAYVYGNKGWSTLDTVNAVDQYARSITAEVMSRNYRFDKAVILGLGDIIHSLNGKTQRGTELCYDTVREEQFDYAMSSLAAFIEHMLAAFGKVEVHSVAGNHFYDVEMALFRALAAYFRTDNRIQFTHYSTRPAAFKVDSTLFVIDHGADSIERSYVPGGAKRETHILNILARHPELLEGTKSRLFCQGDKHHWENIEYGNFEFIMFSTILGADMHSATNNWSNRARQSCLVLDNDGLREIIHHYV